MSTTDVSRTQGLRRLLLLAVFAGIVAALALAAFTRGAHSATSGVIAFTRDDGIYVMRLDGSGVRALWRGGHGLHLTWSPKLTWSPDGRRLAFEAGSAIWTIDADGTHLARIASHAASPAWSPDGRRVAFTRLGTQENPNWPKHAIWVVNADGSGMRQLLSLTRLGRELDVSAGPNSIDWSPDGRQIVLMARYAWWAWIYVVNVDGTNLRRLTENGWACDEDPEWSPDGHRIVYSGTPPEERSIGPTTSEIFVMDAAGRTHTRLTRNWVGDDSPTWSPDGTRIAFVRGSNDIYVMNVDGSGARRLTQTRAAEGSPAWQPVGAR